MHVLAVLACWDKNTILHLDGLRQDIVDRGGPRTGRGDVLSSRDCGGATLWLGVVVPPAFRVKGARGFPHRRISPVNRHDAKEVWGL